ncbi:3',5'-cyclic-nucleotide phosphodiesterase [Aureococcus anophagefferens]|nr:3',5'-cyclic-nucleotide phosphodiesterase [Aureococcus anophagefferens]
MGNAVMSRFKGDAYRQVKVEAVKQQLEEKFKGPTKSRPSERLAFYGRPKLHKEQITELEHLDWFDFLMHTELCTMNYDALTITDDMRFDHMVRMMENLKVPQTLRKPAKELLAFIFDVHELMHDNPYHNFSHVTDVTQYLYTLLLATHLAKRLRPIELAASFIAAVCHDLDHPGLSNTFQCKARTPLAVRWDDESPLENHHLWCSRKLVTKHDLLGGVADERDRARFLGVVRAMILSTDMAKHTKLMARIEGGLAEDGFNPLTTEDGTNLMLQIALKCADISNQARPWKVANQWNEAVYSEFYHEGDLDAAAGRDVQPLQNRKTNRIPNSTAGFIQFIVAPLYEAFVSIMKRCSSMEAEIDSSAVEECLVFLNKNKARYQKQMNGEYVAPDEIEDELQGFAEDLRHSIGEGQRSEAALPGCVGRAKVATTLERCAVVLKGKGARVGDPAFDDLEDVAVNGDGVETIAMAS